jgi:hypothetical protein
MPDAGAGTGSLEPTSDGAAAAGEAAAMLGTGGTGFE